MEDEEVHTRIIFALNETWNGCAPERLSTILFIAGRLAEQFKFKIVLEPAVGFKKG